MQASYRDRASATTRPKRVTGSVREHSPRGAGSPRRGRVRPGACPRHPEIVHGARRRRAGRDGAPGPSGPVRLDARRNQPCGAGGDGGELLEGYVGSAQLWKPATAASHRHVVSALPGDLLCRCRLQSLTPAVMRAAICRWWRGVPVPRLPARWLLIRRAVSWAVAEGLLRLNPLAGMRGPPRPLHRRHRGQDRCAASWLPTVTPSRRRMMRSAADRAPRLAPGGRSPPGSRWCWSAWLRTAGHGGASWRYCGGCRTWTAGS